LGGFYITNYTDINVKEGGYKRACNWGDQNIVP